MTNNNSMGTNISNINPSSLASTEGGDVNSCYNVLRAYQQEAVDFMTAHKSYIEQPFTKGVALEYDDMG